ncbi:MAG: zinc ribbon domain-containing protein [Polyangiaceae bacterium]|nr:zinc ribbon domain-containing protein [Polyangiaceae bacterium]
MFCPNCGTQNAETASTCVKCGFNLRSCGPEVQGHDAREPAAHVSPEPDGRSSRSPWAAGNGRCPADEPQPRRHRRRCSACRHGSDGGPASCAASPRRWRLRRSRHERNARRQSGGQPARRHDGD